MSMCQIKKVSLLEATRHQSTPGVSLNTTDISLNNANLESYKKALHNIVRRLNKTPSASSKTSLRRSDSKLNHTQQPLDTSNSNFVSNTSMKKYYVGSSSSSSTTKNQSVPKRSQSNDGSYKANKELLNKSMQETYLLRKETLASHGVAKSVSINKYPKHEPSELDDIAEEKVGGSDNHNSQNNTLNTTILNEVSLNGINADGDKKLRELVQKYQLRDAMHKQEIMKLRKSNEMLRTHIQDLEKDLDKANKSRDLEKKYVVKLETELSNLKEKMRLDSYEKKSSLSDNKENKYLKTIEELKTQVTNITSEKKVVEHLLKNALMQNENAKENYKTTIKKPDVPSLNISNSKYFNTDGRAKTDMFTKKTIETENCNDENDYTSHTKNQTLNTSFAAPSYSKSDKTEGILKETKENSISSSFAKASKLLNGGNSEMIDMPDLLADHDEAFPDKVAPPQLIAKSLKERIDMNKFKLDFSRIGKAK